MQIINRIFDKKPRGWILVQNIILRINFWLEGKSSFLIIYVFREFIRLQETGFFVG